MPFSVDTCLPKDDNSLENKANIFYKIVLFLLLLSAIVAFDKAIRYYMYDDI
jgi:hypothetical protein